MSFIEYLAIRADFWPVLMESFVWWFVILVPFCIAGWVEDRGRS